MYCPQCGKEVEADSKFCASCGSQIIEERTELSTAKKNDSKIKNHNDNYVDKNSGGWNWFGFLFGPLWYLYKGMITKGIIIFIIGMIAGSIIPGIGAVGVWVYCGLKGNEDLNEHLANR